MEDLFGGGKWSIYIGIVAEDKGYTSRSIKVYPIELLPFMDGDVQDYTSKESVTIKDVVTGKSFTEKISTSNIINAEYFDLNTNRVSPPDVRKGEYVFIFRYQDTDQYYWYSMGRDDDLRKQEHLRLAISDSDETQKELSDDNTYFIELDTLHNKHILLHTSKADGEQYSYTIKIDSQTNKIHIMDDDENEILLDSNVPRIFMRNKRGSFIDINHDDIFVGAIRDLVLKAGRQILTNGPAISIISDGNTVIKVNDFQLNGNNISISGEVLGLNGPTKISDTLVVPHIQCESSSTGSVGSPYPKPDVNLENGKSVSPSYSPDHGSGGADNRHCTAHEEISPALKIIQDC
jgi:hypothetical protein